jgi:hypothetical protein
MTEHEIISIDNTIFGDITHAFINIRVEKFSQVIDAM